MNIMPDENLQRILKSKMIAAAIAAEIAEREESNSNATKISLAEFIKKLRVTKKMTDGDIRKLLGCSRMTLKNWERGIALPSGSDSDNRIPMKQSRIEEASSGPTGPAFTLRRKKSIPSKAYRLRLATVAKKLFGGDIEISWTK
jgi:DNA-binding transcriptional regulator YiaG